MTADTQPVMRTGQATHELRDPGVAAGRGDSSCVYRRKPARDLERPLRANVSSRFQRGLYQKTKRGGRPSWLIPLVCSFPKECPACKRSPRECGGGLAWRGSQTPHHGQTGRARNPGQRDSASIMSVPQNRATSNPDDPVGDPLMTEDDLCRPRDMALRTISGPPRSTGVAT